MGLKAEATAALVFLILYAILFVFLLLGCVTSRIRVRSRYGGIMFYIIVCLASQQLASRSAYFLHIYPVHILKSVDSEIGPCITNFQWQLHEVAMVQQNDFLLHKKSW